MAAGAGSEPPVGHGAGPEAVSGATPALVSRGAPGRAIARGLAALIALDMALLWAGILVEPRAFGSVGDSAGLIIPTLVLLLFAYVLLYSEVAVTRTAAGIIRLEAWLGGGYGLLYAALLIAGYLVPTSSLLGEQTGTIALAALVAACLTAGFVASRRARDFEASALAGARGAMIGTLIWTLAYLAVTYLFWGTEAQAQVLRADGTLAAFSHEEDIELGVFLIRDAQGVVFFQCLVNALLGLLLGLGGGLIGRLASQRR